MHSVILNQEENQEESIKFGLRYSNSEILSSQIKEETNPSCMV